MKSTLKKKMFELLCQEGDVNILIHTTAMGLRIPKTVGASAKEEFIRFVLGRRPSPRLDIRDDGISAFLRFGNKRFQCFFPWDSILQMNSADCIVFFAMGEREKGLLPRQKKGRPILTVIKKEDS